MRGLKRHLGVPCGPLDTVAHREGQEPRRAAPGGALCSGGWVGVVPCAVLGRATAAGISERDGTSQVLHAACGGLGVEAMQRLDGGGGFVLLLLSAGGLRGPRFDGGGYRDAVPIALKVQVVPLA